MRVVSLKGLQVIILLFLTIGCPGQSREIQFIHYTNQDGLPSAYIKDLEQDPFGFVWMVNRENICRFDGYNFTSFPAYDRTGKVFNLRSNVMHKAFDSLLFCKSLAGEFYYFDYTSESFRYFEDLNKLGPTDQMVIAGTGEGVWYANQGKVAYHSLLTINQPDSTVIRIEREAKKLDNVLSFHVSGHSVVLVHARDGQLKATYMGPEKTIHFDSPFPDIALVYLDGHGNMWLGNNELGLCKINLATNQYEFYSEEEKGNRSLNHNFVHVLEEDQGGTLWMGTEGGLCRWNPTEKIFSRSRYSLSDPNGLSSNPIYTAFCDNQGNMWLGMYFSGINLWSNQNQFFKTLVPGVGARYLGGNVVSSFAEDQDGNIWIGLEDNGLNRLEWKTGKIQKFPVGKELGGLSYGNVHDLYFEDPTHLWIATYTGGINILNTKTGKFSYLNTHNTPNLVSNDIYSFHEMGDTIFISSIDGVNIYNRKTKKFSRFFDEIFDGVLIECVFHSGPKIWLSSRLNVYCYDLVQREFLQVPLPDLNGINFIKRDSKGRLWIGDSYSGLYCFDETSGVVKQYSPARNFPGMWIYGMQEGVNGWYWVSTDKGLVKLDPESGVSFLYNKDSGVPFGQFNYRAAFRDSRGIVYFGSNEGLIYFDEYNQKLSARSNKVIFTGLKLFNQHISPGEDRSLLHQSLTLSDKVELPHDQNVFTLEFSGLNYFNQGKCHYAYYLDGFESEYNYVGNRNFATYTNLSPGSYTFKVRASLDNSTWDAEPTKLTIIVHPPFWLSKWGFALYAVLVVALLILISLVSGRIQKSRSLAEMERKERVHAVELNQIKLEFFTNISHELRTPLTLIIGPLVRLINDEKVSPFVKNKLAGINLNAHRLLELLNQLLEFRKIEQGKEDLKVCEASISDLFANLEQSFSMTAEENQMTLNFDCKEAPGPMWFDPSKLEKILINLISNAFKYTNTGGAISVIAKVVSMDDDGGQKQVSKLLRVTVKDTGRGMEPKVINQIFDRFYQFNSNNPDKQQYYGFGIGLAFVQKLVQLHKGEIWVKSKPGIGTVFKMEVPVSKHHYEAQEMVEAVVVYGGIKYHEVPTAVESVGPEELPAGPIDKPKILVVEDNEQLMGFIKNSLSDYYTIISANNGKEALEKLSIETVDLILSDVMMPVMDGFEFTEKVKSTIETSHLPVILLTAKSGMENRYEGLKTGADYYIEKPFLDYILHQNISNVLKTRRNLIHKFKRDALMPASELTHSESDRKFVENLTDLIKSNINKSDMDVGFLTRGMGLSRSMLHIKLKKIADCSATEFINTVRLKEALQIMVEKGCNVSEAAYQTGFSSPTYFTRRFKQYYGQSPRDFLQKELTP